MLIKLDKRQHNSQITLTVSKRNDNTFLVGDKLYSLLIKHDGKFNIKDYEYDDIDNESKLPSTPTTPIAICSSLLMSYHSVIFRNPNMSSISYVDITIQSDLSLISKIKFIL